MEKCGLVSVSFRKNSPEEIVKLMKKADLSFVEWGSDVHVPEGNERHAELVRRLTEQAGIEVDKKKIEIPEPIKAFGTYSLEVKLYGDISGKINVVVAEK